MLPLLPHLLARLQQEGPDIIPDHGAGGESNLGGVVVVAVLLTGWLLAGLLLYRRSRRRP